MWTVLTFHNVIAALAAFFDLEYIKKRFSPYKGTRAVESRVRKTGKHPNVTAKEYLKESLPSEFDFAGGYANIITGVVSAGILCPVFPLAPLLSFCGLYIQKPSQTVLL